MQIYVFKIGVREVCFPATSLLSAYVDARRCYPSAFQISVLKVVS